MVNFLIRFSFSISSLNGSAVSDRLWLFFTFGFDYEIFFSHKYLSVFDQNNLLYDVQIFTFLKLFGV
jgi:hypothetical protein